jgi:hypothetical protein
MINTEDTITFSVQNGDPHNMGYQTVLSKVSAMLAALGMQLQLNSAQGSDFTTQLTYALNSFQGTPYTLSIDVTVGEDYNTADDVGSIVANAFYTVSGSYPTISAISVNGFSTGQSAAGGPGGVQPGRGFSDYISDFFGGLKTDTTIALVVIVGIVVLVLVLAAYGPNVGGIARAAAAV